MDLTEEQEAALEQVQSAFDPDAFDEALQEHAENYREPAFDAGHQAGFGEVNRKLEQAKQEAESAKETLQEKEQQIESLREEQPDLQDKRQQWEENELQPMQERVNELQSRLTNGKKETVQEKLKSSLTSNVKHEWVAEQAVRQNADRIEVTENGEVKFYREDGETPYPEQNGKSPMERFGEDVLSAVPDDFVADNTQGGKDRSISGSGGSGGSTDGKSKSEMTDKEAAEFVSEHGADAYRELPA